MTAASDASLKAYLDAWAMSSRSTPESVAAMIAGACPGIALSDVNSPNVHRGHDGIRHICSLATGKYAGAAIVWRDLLCDGRNWSIRWTFSGMLPDGQRFSAEGASAGRLAEDGRVIEQTDYWNRAGMPEAAQ
jgi:hypothetical protein